MKMIQTQTNHGDMVIQKKEKSIGHDYKIQSKVMLPWRANSQGSSLQRHFLSGGGMVDSANDADVILNKRMAYASD